MMLVWLIIIPAVGGLLAWLAEHRTRWLHPRWVALITLIIEFILILSLWVPLDTGDHGVWLAELRSPWIPRFGISFHLALDGLSLLLIALTALLGIIAVASAWIEITQRVGFFYFNLLMTLAGVIGVFLALDLFLFFVFWEVMLVPMYFIISVWGHEHRIYAAIKFFIFTQGSGLFMLVAILALAFVNYQNSGHWTFDYFDLRNVDLSSAAALWIMLGFFIAFAVKLPAFPFHTWLPDAHTEAPTAGSVILAGVLLKTGAYGLLRFVVPLFPEAAFSFAPFAMILGVIGILYGAMLAFAQDDFKRLVAYSSVSHMGFVLLGVFAWNVWALQGAVMQMIAHGISTAALFMLAGLIQERLHTRDMRRMGGLWASMPRMGAMVLFFAVASLGLPGLANFVGEFLVLLGTYRVNVTLAVLAVLGIITAAAYALILVQRSFQGEPRGT
ncbi:MAG: NADH-quinone oxidoreductase subunit M, partial [Pseudomonadota bacterium]|nr:NADH-quinone oxidoreductase subunit M [Pseudomonadota bacterium]